MKRLILVLAALVIFSSILTIVSAQKLDVVATKDIFAAGEEISFKVSLLDSNNNPLTEEINILVEDALGITSIEKVVESNSIVNIYLGDKAPAGYWKISAFYKELTARALFLIESSELVKFELINNTLRVTNIGNSLYEKTIQIAIGETISPKQISLVVGESTSFRLVAPEGVYNVRVSDGKTSLNQSGVALTGKIIGILDNKELSQGPLTTGVKGEETLYEETNPPARNNGLVYTFLLVVLGAGILLAIERRFRKKAQSNNNPIRAD